jgi:hypothetical protein
VAIGHSTLNVQNFTTSTQAYNTAIGHNAGAAVTTGVNNVLIGGLAGDAQTTAEGNVAVGYASLTTAQKSQLNTALGNLTLQTLNHTTTTNAYNVAVGASAGRFVTTGVQNTFIGGLAGDATVDSSDNTAVGYQALSADSGGTSTAVGSAALLVATGYDNTALGFAAGIEISTGNNNTALGHDALRTGSPGGPITTQSNRVGLGDENITSFNCAVSLTAASDQRDKTDFVDLDLGLDFVKALEPVTYYWDKRSKYGDKYADDYDLNAQTPDGTHKEDWMDVGFTAQSVQALEEAAGYKVADKKNLTVSVNADGKQLGLRYEKFVPILVKAIQDQDAIIQSLTARITALES